MCFLPGSHAPCAHHDGVAYSLSLRTSLRMKVCRLLSLCYPPVLYSCVLLPCNPGCVGTSFLLGNLMCFKGVPRPRCLHCSARCRSVISGIPIRTPLPLIKNTSPPGGGEIKRKRLAKKCLVHISVFVETFVLCKHLWCLNVKQFVKRVRICRWMSMMRFPGNSWLGLPVRI